MHKKFYKTLCILPIAIFVCLCYNMYVLKREERKEREENQMEEIKIDKRHNYVLVLDTETANTLTDENGSLNMDYVLFYDCGVTYADKVF